MSDNCNVLQFNFQKLVTVSNLRKNFFYLNFEKKNTFINFFRQNYQKLSENYQKFELGIHKK